MAYTFFILACITATALCEQLPERTWEILPGYGIHISAKKDQLWAVNFYNQVVQWQNGGWVHPESPNGAGAARSVAASPDGYGWTIPLHGLGPHRYRPDQKNYEAIGGSLTQVSALSKDYIVTANANGDFWIWDNGWQLQNRKVSQIAVGDNKEMWMIDANSVIHRFSQNKWVSGYGNAVNIDVQNATRVVITDYMKNAYVYEDRDWKQLAGFLCKQATIDYECVYCVSSDGVIAATRVWGDKSTGCKINY